MPPRERVLPVRISDAEAAGLSRKQLRGGAWRRIGPGQYAPAGRAERVDVLLAAMQERLPRLAVFADRTAGWLHGLDLEPARPIQVLAAPEAKISARAGAAVRRAELDEADIVEIDGFRATSALRTVLDLGSRLHLVEAVIAIDMALHAGLVSGAELGAAVALSTGRKGSVQLRRVVQLMDGNAESPMETRLRVLLLRAGFPRPQSQVSLHDREGAFIGRTDLYYPDRRVAIEFDGGAHRDQLVEDNRRQNLLVGSGVHLLRFTSADVFGQPERILRQVADALGTPAIRRRLARLEDGNGRIRRRMEIRELAS